MGLFEGVNQQRLLPVRQELQVDAQVFFYDFVGLLQQVMLELQMLDVATKRFDLSLQLRSLGLRLWRQICGVSWMLEPPGRASWFFQLYNVGLHTPSFSSNRLRTFMTSAQLEDYQLLHLRRPRHTDGSADNALPVVGMQLTNPGGQGPSRRIAQRLHGCSDAATMVEVVLDGLPLLILRILRPRAHYSRQASRGARSILPMPALQSSSSSGSPTGGWSPQCACPA